MTGRISPRCARVVAQTVNLLYRRILIGGADVGLKGQKFRGLPIRDTADRQSTASRRYRAVGGMGDKLWRISKVFSLERESKEGVKLSVRKLSTIREMAVLAPGQSTAVKHTQPKKAGIKAREASDRKLHHCWSSQLQSPSGLCRASSAAIRLTPDACTHTWSGFTARHSVQNPPDAQTSPARLGTWWSKRLWILLSATFSRHTLR